MKLITLPEQIAVVVVATVIVGITVGFTLIVMLFEVAAFVVVQAALLVMMQETISLLLKLVEE